MFLDDSNCSLSIVFIIFLRYMQFYCINTRIVSCYLSGTRLVVWLIPTETSNLQIISETRWYNNTFVITIHSVLFCDCLSRHVIYRLFVRQTSTAFMTRASRFHVYNLLFSTSYYIVYWNLEDNRYHNPNYIKLGNSL